MEAVLAVAAIVISPILGALTALTVARFNSRSGHEAWMRDQRLTAYRAMSDATEPFLNRIAEGSPQTSWSREEVVITFSTAIRNLTLVAPAEVRDRGQGLLDDIEAGRAFYDGQFPRDVRAFIDVLREDVIPSRMRSVSRDTRKVLPPPPSR